MTRTSARSPVKPQEAKPKRSPAAQKAEIERVAREHGADLNEEGFNEALRKVARASEVKND